jgi:hypothetical protein
MLSSGHPASLTQFVSPINTSVAAPRRIHGSQGLHVLGVRAATSFLRPPISRQNIQSGVSAFNSTSRTWPYPRGTGALCKPPSPGARSRNNLWLTTTLVIGLVASPSRPGSAACDIAIEPKRPAATLGNSRARVIPARFSRVITAAGCLSSTPSRRALTAPAPPSIVQPPLTDLSAEVEPLRSDFNRNASSVRLLLILSPS